MKNQTENNDVPSIVDTYQIGSNAVTVRSVYTGNETLQDILKRLIMREYERQASRFIY